MRLQGEVIKLQGTTLAGGASHVWSTGLGISQMLRVVVVIMCVVGQHACVGQNVSEHRLVWFSELQA